MPTYPVYRVQSSTLMRQKIIRRKLAHLIILQRMKIVSLLVSLECKIKEIWKNSACLYHIYKMRGKGLEKMTLGFLRSFPKFHQLKTLVK